MRALLFACVGAAALTAASFPANALSVGVNRSVSGGFGFSGNGVTVGASGGSSTSLSVVVAHDGTAGAGGSYGSTGNSFAGATAPGVCIVCATSSSSNGTSTTSATRQ